MIYYYVTMDTLALEDSCILLTMLWVRNSGGAPLGSFHLLQMVSAEVARLGLGDSLPTRSLTWLAIWYWLSAGSLTGAVGQGPRFFITWRCLGFLKGHWLYRKSECSKRQEVEAASSSWSGPGRVA